jgi:stalled ribosome alternative rescue factor ArfA
MEKIKFKINPNELKTRTFSSQEIGRGIGVQKVKKGKVSYTRKPKHKKQYNSDSNYTAFLFI